ncbi:MAG TPA: MSEP-CTERM sorting domain-containing protein, partial [Patescibacteria group bacterium]|nr:MSEP-CTERM sorting domain-containing protein [Patescibacteria group bacterium]
MKKIFSPLFIIAFVTLPQLLSLGYLSAAFGPANIQSMIIPLIAIFFVSIFFMVYAYRIRREEVIRTKVFAVISAVYTVIIAISILFGPESFFLNTSTSPKLIFIAACMISVIYGIMGLAYNTTPPGKACDIARYVVGIVFTPFIWFLGINFVSGVNANAITLILIIASIYALIFFIIKLFFIWRLRKTPFSFDAIPPKKYYIAVTVIALCMPLLGLLVNQTFSDFGIGNNSVGLFGNFSHPMFYIIAVLNGILLLVPPIKNKRLRLMLFFFKSAGYTYILYFFVVFIPLLPLGLVGIIFYGLGLLVLTPLFVALLQGYHLVKEWIILSKSWSLWQVTAVFCIGIIALPLCITATVWGDRANFATAAQYLEQKDLSHSSPVDLKKLQRTLDNIEDNLQTTRGMLGISSNNTPILSQLYTRLILDGKILSQDNVLTMENLFFDAGHDLTSNNLSNPDIVNNNVRLLDAVSETRFDDKIGVYRSWINLKLENAPYADNGEYV